MTEGIVLDAREIARFDELENGKTRPDAAGTFVMLMTPDVGTTAIDWFSAQTKSTLLAYECKTYTDAAGQVPSGYARQRLGWVASLAGDTFFPQPGNPWADGQQIYLAGDAISGVNSGRPYYVVRSTSVSFAIATSPGGAALTGLNPSGLIVVKPTGSYNPTTNRVEVLESVRFVGQNSFFCAAVAILKGGAQQTNVWLDGFDNTTATVEIAEGHNLTTGDEIAFNTASGNLGLPQFLVRFTPYWVRVLSPTQFTIHRSQIGALTNADQVMFGAKPIGLYDVWMIYASGEVDFVCQFGQTIQLRAGENLLIQVASYHNNWGVQIGR
jgi:hypothetical protein